MEERSKASSEEIRGRIRAAGGDILDSERFRRGWKVRHHNTNLAQHSLRVAAAGIRLCDMLRKRGLEPDEREVVRACLLHDIGMTEETVHGKAAWKKAYEHPRESARIAVEEYGATEDMKNAILRHMWPICVKPPGRLTGWIVVTADKIATSQDLRKKEI